MKAGFGWEHGPFQIWDAIGVEKGIESVADSGILAGFPLIDYKVTIVDGLHHDVESSVLAFEIASRYCLRTSSLT